jgi:hypothetical protein
MDWPGLKMTCFLLYLRIDQTFVRLMPPSSPDH